MNNWEDALGNALMLACAVALIVCLAYLVWSVGKVVGVLP